MVSTFLFKSSHRWNRQMILSPCTYVHQYTHAPRMRSAQLHTNPKYTDTNRPARHGRDIPTCKLLLAFSSNSVEEALRAGFMIIGHTPPFFWRCFLAASIKRGPIITLLYLIVVNSRECTAARPGPYPRG